MNAPAELVTLTIGEATITVPSEVAAMAYIEKLLADARPIPLAMPRPAIPIIGADRHGGKCAGLSIRDNDPVELVLLPGEFNGPWEKAKAWAKEQGGELPTRIDQLALFKNLKGEFQSEYYWSGEQCAGNVAYAWGQGFGNGYRDFCHKGDDGRARAARAFARGQ